MNCKYWLDEFNKIIASRTESICTVFLNILIMSTVESNCTFWSSVIEQNIYVHNLTLSRQSYNYSILLTWQTVRCFIWHVQNKSYFSSSVNSSFEVYIQRKAWFVGHPHSVWINFIYFFYRVQLFYAFIQNLRARLLPFSYFEKCPQFLKFEIPCCESQILKNVFMCQINSDFIKQIVTWLRFCSQFHWLFRPHW